MSWWELLEPHGWPLHTGIVFAAIAFVWLLVAFLILAAHSL